MFRTMTLPLVLLAMLLAGNPAALLADSGDTITGRYTGVAESEDIGDVPVTADIWYANGKISGYLYTQRGRMEMYGTYGDDGYWRVRLIAGDNEGLVEGALVEVGLFTGSWRFGDATGVIVLEKQ